MKKLNLVSLLFFILFSFCLITPITISAESIPDNNSSSSSNGSSGYGLDLKPVDAADVFGSGVEAKDDTGYADAVNSVGVTVMKFIVNTCVYLFAIFFTVVFIVDCVCIPFPALNKMFAEKIPIQLFSNEVAAVTGIPYSYGGNSGGSAPPPPPANNGNGEQTLAGKYTAYARDRAIALIFSGVLMVLTYTGLMQDLLNLAINAIVGLIIK
jgi:hypothetical protein